MGPDNSQDSFGQSLKPNRRLSNHFGPNFMFWAPPGTLVSQDFGLAWLWANLIIPGILAWPGFGLGLALGKHHFTVVETGQMSGVETRQMLKSQIRGRAQNHPNGPKWVEHGRQVLRIGPNESHGRSTAFGTGPVAKTPAKSACSGV